MDEELFVGRMSRNIESGDAKEAAMIFTEEMSLSGFRHGQMKSAVEKLNEQLTSSSLPTINLVESAGGVIKEAYLNDGTFYDTLLYKRPEMLDRPQWRHADIEYLASHLEAVEELDKESPRTYKRSDFQRAAEFLVNEALERDEARTRYTLLRASKESYKDGHSLNVVLADLDGDGARDDLSDVALSYSEFIPPHRSLNERIDLYDPPAAELFPERERK